MQIWWLRNYYQPVHSQPPSRGTRFSSSDQDITFVKARLEQNHTFLE